MVFRAPSPPTRGVAIPVAPSAVERILAGGVAVLVTLGSAVAVLQISFGHDHLMGLVQLANLNGEQNLPTWFSSVQLLLAAGASAIAMRVCPANDRRHWALLVAVFLTMSLDEAAAIHELSNAPLRGLIGTGGVLFFPWVLIGVAVAAAVALMELQLLTRLPRATAVGLVSGGACFLAGALGLEVLAGPVYAAGAKLTLQHAALVTAEETLEMIGIALFVATVLRYVATRPGFTAEISPRRFFTAALTVAGTLAAVSVLAQWWAYSSGETSILPWVRLVNLTREGNIPTWWQFSTLLACGALAATIARAAHDNGEARRTREWAAVATAFLYLSMDEGAGIHELAVRPLRQMFNTTGLLYYPWIVIGAAAAAVVAFGARRFVAALPRRTRRTLLLAAGVFLAGALGFEAVGGMVAEDYGRANMRYAAISTLEELFEMFGVALAAKAMLEHIRDHVGVVRVGSSAAAAASTAWIPSPESAGRLRTRH
jgi:hypothetical protein